MARSGHEIRSLATDRRPLYGGFPLVDVITRGAGVPVAVPIGVVRATGGAGGGQIMRAKNRVWYQRRDLPVRMSQLARIPAVIWGLYELGG